jgi:hypothetical protein
VLGFLLGEIGNWRWFGVVGAVHYETGLFLVVLEDFWRSVLAVADVDYYSFS